MATIAPPRPRTAREKFYADVPFLKAPASSNGDIELSGYASTWGLDRDAEMVDPKAFEKSLSLYLSKNPMVLWQHNMDWPIGRVVDGSTDETGLRVKAIIPDPGPMGAEWQRGAYISIKNDIVRTFSIGGYMTRDIKAGPGGPVLVITDVELFEISCVSIPANADSIYSAVMKMAKGIGPRLSDKATEQMEQLLGFVETTDAELLRMDGDARAARYGELAKMFETVHEAPAPEYDSWQRIVKAREAGVSPVKIAPAVTLLARSFYMPQKAGRAISASNRQKLEAALGHHDDLEQHMIDAAESMKAAAGAHSEAVKAIQAVIGEPVPDPDQDPRADEPPNSPEKGLKGPPGDPQALIDWYNNGADGQINWGQPGDFDQCVAVASQHLDDPEGFCNLRHQDAVGGPPGSEDSGKALPKCPKCETTISDPSKGCPNPDCDYKVPQKSAKQLASAVRQALRSAAADRFASPDPDADIWVFVDDFDLDEGYAIYCVYSGGGGDDTYWQIPFSRGDDGSVALLPGGQMVEPTISYQPKGLDKSNPIKAKHVALGDQADDWDYEIDDFPDAKAVLSVPSAAFADRDTAWDASGAKARVKDWSGAGDSPNDKAKQAYLWQDGDGSNWSDLKYPVCDVIDGSLKCVFRAVSAAAARANQQSLDALKPPLAKLYARAGKQFGDDSIQPPWEDS